MHLVTVLVPVITTVLAGSTSNAYRTYMDPPAGCESLPLALSEASGPLRGVDNKHVTDRKRPFVAPHSGLSLLTTRFENSGMLSPFLGHAGVGIKTRFIVDDMIKPLTLAHTCVAIRTAMA